MKKIVIASLLLSSLSFAQDIKWNVISAGAQAGVNTSPNGLQLSVGAGVRGIGGSPIDDTGFCPIGYSFKGRTGAIVFNTEVKNGIERRYIDVNLEVIGGFTFVGPYVAIKNNQNESYQRVGGGLPVFMITDGGAIIGAQFGFSKQWSQYNSFLSSTQAFNYTKTTYKQQPGTEIQTLSPGMTYQTVLNNISKFDISSEQRTVDFSNLANGGSNNWTAPTHLIVDVQEIDLGKLNLGIRAGLTTLKTSETVGGNNVTSNSTTGTITEVNNGVVTSKEITYYENVLFNEMPELKGIYKSLEANLEFSVSPHKKKYLRFYLDASLTKQKLDVIQDKVNIFNTKQKDFNLVFGVNIPIVNK